MAKWGKCDFDELKHLQDCLQGMENTIDEFCEQASKELAARLLSLVIPATPLGKYPKGTGKNGGTLRRGWTAKTHDEAAGGSGQPSAVQAKEYAKSLPVEKSGNYYIIRVINPVEYSSYVEFGHRQTPGRFVPAIGKRLKSGWVNGQYFLTLSEEKLRAIAPGILQRKLDAFLREMLK